MQKKKKSQKIPLPRPQEPAIRQILLLIIIVINDDNNNYYGSTALCWAFTAFFSFLIYTQSVGLFGLGISPSQGL
jgi:hypothetical protein